MYFLHQNTVEAGIQPPPSKFAPLDHLNNIDTLDLENNQQIDVVSAFDKSIGL